MGDVPSIFGRSSLEQLSSITRFESGLRVSTNLLEWLMQQEGDYFSGPGTPEEEGASFRISSGRTIIPKQPACQVCAEGFAPESIEAYVIFAARTVIPSRTKRGRYIPATLAPTTELEGYGLWITHYDEQGTEAFIWDPRMPTAELQSSNYQLQSFVRHLMLHDEIIN